MLIHQNLNDWTRNGRIGNQFFKVASLIGIATKNNTGYALDQEWDYQKYFGIQLPISKLRPIAHIRDQQPYYHYHEIILNPSKVYGVEAYLQSEKYFEHCKNYIREFFTLKSEYADPLKESNKDKLNRVGVHVRRTDFVGNGCTPALPLDYYVEAFTYFPDKEFLVFSDDIEWCKQQAVFQGERFQYQDRGVDILDLYLMSFISGIVTANSSYSWWSAWLGEQNQGENFKIISPHGWFGGWTSGSLVPERWKRVGPKFWDEPGI